MIPILEWDLFNNYGSLESLNRNKKRDTEWKYLLQCLPKIIISMNDFSIIQSEEVMWFHVNAHLFTNNLNQGASLVTGWGIANDGVSFVNLQL